MPDRHEALQQGTANDPFMATIVLVIIALLAAVIALAAGLTWKGLLHWTGELFLIIGILLAAKGIGDVRREWTGRLGFWGSIKQKAQSIRVRAASFLWVQWNRAVERWPRLARWMRLRTHSRHVADQDAGTSVEAVRGVAVFPPPRVVATEGGTEERLRQLEARMEQAQKELDTFYAWRTQEVRHREDATDRERAERDAADQGIRESIANLAGGGLRLQAWGVACLLAGTLMTAIW